MNPLTNKTYTLQRFPGPGGWTYAAIPEVPQPRDVWFGWVHVKGFIDDYEIKAAKLMPKGDGTLFLPVKAEIRKKIKKEAGDRVKITLYRDIKAEDLAKIQKDFRHT